MSIFTTLGTLQDIFLQSHRVRSQELFKKSKAPVRCVVWAVFPIFVTSVVIFTESFFRLRPLYSNTWLNVSLGLALVWFLVLAWARYRHFRDYYCAYAIHKNGFWRSWKLLHYALFVERLEERLKKSELTIEDVKRVWKWSKHAELPRKDTFLRHPVGMIMLVLAVNLCLELIKKWDAVKPSLILVYSFSLGSFCLSGMGYTVSPSTRVINRQGYNNS
jgi:hypothetical protein